MDKIRVLNDEIQSSKYIACICEGNAERAILDLLLEHGRLKFNFEQLLEGELIKERNAKKFEERYLRKGFSEKIMILRILDSRREKFKLSKVYENKIKVINVITAPEIEMLVILNEKKYADFKKSGKKPSDYCKENLKMSNVKTYAFMQEYFKEVDMLVDAVKEYQRVSAVQKEEYTIFHLLASNS